MIKGVKIAMQAPTISSLCFAYDTLLFWRATMEEVVNLKRILHTYVEVFGQLINFEKSSMTFSWGTKQNKQNLIQGILGVTVVNKHDKYL